MSDHLRLTKQIHKQIADQRALLNVSLIESLKTSRRQIHTSHDLTRTAHEVRAPRLLNSVRR